MVRTVLGGLTVSRPDGGVLVDFGGLAAGRRAGERGVAAAAGAGDADAVAAGGSAEPSKSDLTARFRAKKTAKINLNTVGTTTEKKNTKKTKPSAAWKKFVMPGSNRSDTQRLVPYAE